MDLVHAAPEQGEGADDGFSVSPFPACPAWRGLVPQDLGGQRDSAWGAPEVRPEEGLKFERGWGNLQAAAYCCSQECGWTKPGQREAPLSLLGPPGSCVAETMNKREMGQPGAPQHLDSWHPLESVRALSTETEALSATGRGLKTKTKNQPSTIPPPHLNCPPILHQNRVAGSSFKQ